MTKFDAFNGLTFEEKCEFWATRISRYNYLINDNRAVTIRFEDFVNDPEQALRLVYKHLGLEFDKNSVQFLKTNIIHPLDQNDKIVNPKNEFSKRPPPYLEWSDNQRDIFKRVCSEAMLIAGYEIPF
jgi:hypothetical protein